MIMPTSICYRHDKWKFLFCTYLISKPGWWFSVIKPRKDLQKISWIDVCCYTFGFSMLINEEGKKNWLKLVSGSKTFFLNYCCLFRLCLASWILIREVVIGYVKNMVERIMPEKKMATIVEWRKKEWDLIKYLEIIFLFAQFIVNLLRRGEGEVSSYFLNLRVGIANTDYWFNRALNHSAEKVIGVCNIGSER